MTGDINLERVAEERIGQQIVNFQEWCKNEKEVPDIFYISDITFLKLWKEFVSYQSKLYER